jgi:hypothetical protein
MFSKVRMARLDPSRETRLMEGARHASQFFMGEADVQRALQKIARLLRDDGIPYALVGAMALNEHGYRRTTVDVDLLFSREGLADFKEKHLGRGYVEKFPGSKGFRDVENGVVIDVVLAGDYPGDGKPKPVRFPDPATTALVGESLSVLSLPLLVNLKLASGMTAPHRLRDLADVLELVRIVGLPESFAEELDPYVRGKYRELWHAAQGARDE